MPHANAALTPRQRLRVARLIVDEGWSVARLIVDEGWSVAHAAAFFHIAWPTAKRWADRYAAMGARGWPGRRSLFRSAGPGGVAEAKLGVLRAGLPGRVVHRAG